MSHPLLQEDAGSTHLLLGNEAIVRGALEAGVNVITCYPGTPSSEVPDTFYRIGKVGGNERYRMEYSVNEKVALEVGAGASLAGALTLVTMKHVGVNVAADPLFTTVYTGLPGGLVLLSADDPGCHSSQNEQDNRYYARFASMPCFEPSTAAEACAMTRDALLLAREYEQPVLLRTTTRLNHQRGPVTFNALPAPADIKPFERCPQRFVPVPAVARNRHVILEENMKKIQGLVEKYYLRTKGENASLGIITTGIARAYLNDALMAREADNWRDKVDILELGMTWPLAENALINFLKEHSTVLVLEEGALLLENEIRALAQQADLKVRIEGKDDILTIQGEYDFSKVSKKLARLFGEDIPAQSQESAHALPMPNRPPNLCAGCSHRAVYYAVRSVFGDEAHYPSDIGCYTLGILPPLRMADFLVCMGASISAGSGFASISPKPVIAFIGDSTFFHTGLNGLANAVFNKHNLILVILDNGTTAMTGHQPNPGMDQEVLGSASLHLDIESIVRGMGVPHVRKSKAYNLRSTVRALEELKAESGVRVLIAEEPCVLYARRTLKRNPSQVAYVAEQNDDAKRCVENFACPAFVRDDKGIHVDPTLCVGCMVCLQVAPKAFKAQRREKV